MFFNKVIAGVFLLLMSGLTPGPRSAAARTDKSFAATSLILEKQEGVEGSTDLRAQRWELLQILKVGPVNSGSKHLIVFTEELPPGNRNWMRSGHIIRKP